MLPTRLPPGVVVVVVVVAPTSVAAASSPLLPPAIAASAPTPVFAAPLTTATASIGAPPALACARASAKDRGAGDTDVCADRQEHCSALMYAVGQPAPVPAMRHNVNTRGHCVRDSWYSREAHTVSTVLSWQCAAWIS